MLEAVWCSILLLTLPLPTLPGTTAIAAFPYRSAGTVRFLCDGDAQLPLQTWRLYFSTVQNGVTTITAGISNQGRGGVSFDDDKGDKDVGTFRGGERNVSRGGEAKRGEAREEELTHRFASRSRSPRRASRSPPPLEV